MHRVLFGLLAALLVLPMSLLSVAAAQDATPAVADAGVACTVEPRPVDELLTLWFSPEGTPLATPEPAAVVPAGEAALPQGEPADEETVAAVNGTLQQLAACFEANQFARAFALMTEDLVRQFGPQAGETLEQARELLEAQIAAGAPAPPGPATTATEVPQLRDVRVLEDGRVGAVLEEENQTVFVIFEQVNGEWLIDEFLPVLAGAAESTPAA